MKPGASCSCTESLHHKGVRLPTADILKPGDGDGGNDDGDIYADDIAWSAHGWYSKSLAEMAI